MIKTIIFDLDDTLYRERDFVYGAFKKVCEYLALKFNKDYEKLYNSTIDILNIQGRGRIFNMLCDKYNINEDISNLVDIYRNAKSSLTLYGDALYFLEECSLGNIALEKNSLGNKRVEFNLGIITDGKASVQWNKIKALKLQNYIDKIIVTDDYGLDYWKPNEFAYKEMMKYFNCEAEECIYVGDNPNKDFIGARKVHMHTVRVIREIGDHMSTFLDETYEADFIIKSLYELKNIIYKCNYL
ncbi:HAD-IA family hydrolase [Clostridium sp. P21]|uniref:HAD-IA family hydrolase n=1 Tax=Clostridium muellerianum TaxID=2716538 RepID=A0A7Y0ED97_9CLOT|nr:HAD-IA family hydrolase [Clostridium muellerianum]NMM61288.1 HAD-IA family hydrolase [Clostridium muellerianum]